MKIASVQAKLLLLTACSASDNPHKFVRTRNTMSENMPREAAESFKSQSSSAGKQPFPLRVSSQQDVANEIADPALIINRENDDAFADKLYDSFQLIVITPPATNELGDQMADDDYSDDAAGVRFEWIPKDSAFNNAVITPSPLFSPTRTPTASPNTRAPSTAQPTTLQPSTLTPSLQPTVSFDNFVEKLLERIQLNVNLILFIPYRMNHLKIQAPTLLYTRLLRQLLIQVSCHP